MPKKHEYIQKYIKELRPLVKSGDISSKLVTDFQIYQVYKGYGHVKSKMERYQFVAQDLRTSYQVVMRAVKSMESSM